MSAAANLVALSATHHTAGLDARASFAVGPEGVETFYAAVRAAGLSEAVLLVTCNRLEAYVVGDEAAALHARDALMRAAAGGASAVDAHLRPMPGLQAVEHLFAVVAGLDSQMVGEAEVAGQTKDAYADALARGMTGPVLNRLFQRAFQAAAWARTNTGISRGQVSFGNVAVDLATRVFGSLDDARVLVFGTGDAGRSVVKALVSRGATQVSVASRTFENARALAEEMGGSALLLADAIRQAHAHDVIVGCAAVERPLLDAEAVRGLLSRRQGRPLLLVDLGVPRNFAAAARGAEGAYLCDLDDLAEVANANLRARRSEVDRARAALDEKAARAWSDATRRPQAGS
ncbi:MAG: glutamyl-tRNA reductase [Verrucomicrobia bacterium]|nr:glutamyl-tRNA reductase [Verrucomicrobiota bacterium]